MTTILPERPTALVDLRHPLPTRPINGPHSSLELTCARATLASAAARLPIPHLAWQPLPDGHAAAHLVDGTLLIHTATDGRAPHWTAHVPCPHGAHHQHPVTSPSTLHQARTATATCTGPHTTAEDQDQAVIEGTRPTRPAVRALGEGLHRARTATDQPKEHPEP
ncbi:hypothetical protein ABZ383_27425 [Streptomyces sp. NPDC005900]|uniref:hypothetical protein n=1 Tax=Streptomyces sp. NPDC005900 TaxID=3154569 RepID=UPI0033E05C66